MKSATLESSAKERQRKPEMSDEPDHSETEKERIALRQIDEAIAECRSLYRSPLISQRTRNAYEDDWENLRSKRNVEWMQGNVTFLLQALNHAESYRVAFQEALDEAVSKDWIDNATREQQWNDFYDPNLLEWDRKEWLNTKFPAIRRGWKKAADDRKDVLALAKKEKLTALDIPELAELEDTGTFLSLHPLSKINTIAAVHALILSRPQNKEQFIGSVRKELDNAVKAGWLHGTNVGPWMRSVMESNDPEAFAAQTLWPFIRSCKETRADFDRLNAALAAQGIPRGFRPVKAEVFLLMNPQQQTSYCALAWIRLENAEEQDKELASLKLRIRYNLDTKDWEGAESDLRTAMTIRPVDYELRVLQEYLQTHRTDRHTESDVQGGETPDPQKLVDDLRSVIGTIPGSLGWLYQHAAQDGVETLSCLQQIIRNAPWTEEHGQKNEETTHVILDGETSSEDSIDDDCDAPQYLYMETEGREAVVQKAKKNADNPRFRDWSIVVPKDMSPEMQSDIVRNRHTPMKNMLRKLNSMGYRYTLTGKVEKA